MMKFLRLYKQIYLIFFIFPLSIYGQNTRTVDLKIRIINPINGSYIKSPGSIDLKFSAFNKGPNDLKPLDTLRFYPRTNDSLFKFRYVNFSKVITPGDSDIFSLSVPFNSKFDNNYYMVCINSAIAFNRSDVLLAENTNTDIDNSNCITVKHRSATSSIETNSHKNLLSFYPNPCSDKLKINIPDFLLTRDGKLVLTDGIGQVLVSQKIQPSSNTFNLDLNNISNGCYFLTYLSGNTILSAKVAVNK